MFKNKRMIWKGKPQHCLSLIEFLYCKLYSQVDLIKIDGKNVQSADYILSSALFSLMMKEILYGQF